MTCRRRLTGCARPKWKELAERVGLTSNLLYVFIDHVA